ncbi:DUF58 domain-containing protein [Chloroflexota bacterium]
MKKRLVAVLLFVIAVATATATGADLILHLAIFTALIVLLSYMWVFFNSRGLALERKPLSERYQVGDYVEQEFSVYNESGFPKLLLRTQEYTDIPGYLNNRVFNAPANNHYRWKARAFCGKRGLFRLGSVRITATDPLGLFSKINSMGIEHKITVCPQTVSLPHFEPLAYRGFNYGAHLPTSQVSTNVATVREYVNGDELTHLHWRTTAHTGKLMVKLFDPERSSRAIRRVWNVLDMQQSLMAGEGLQSTEEYGLTIAASIMKKYIDQGCEVGFSAFGDRQYHFNIDYGQEHLRNMLYAMAVMQASGSEPIEQLIPDVARHLNEESLLVIITPSVSERLAFTLRQAVKSGCLIAAVLLDAPSFGATKQGNIFRTLISNSVQVYSVKCGDDISVTMNSRKPY